MLLLLVLALAAGCGLRRPAPMPDRSRDAAIEQAVERRLAAEPALDSEALRVEVDGGVVLLYGSVRGLGAWRCALRAAELVPDVRSVVDYLTLEPGPRELSCAVQGEPAPDTLTSASRRLS